MSTTSAGRRLQTFEQLLEIARESSTAIVCAEEDPGHRHRRLVTPALQQNDVKVEHFRGDGCVQTEDEFGGGMPQLRLFE